MNTDNYEKKENLDKEKEQESAKDYENSCEGSTANENPETETEKKDNSVKEEQIEKKKLPLFSKILFGIAGGCALLYILFLIFPAFSDFFNRYISSVFRGILSYITVWIPFSFAEFLLIFAPIILVVIVIWGVKHYGTSWRNVGVFCLIVLSIASYIFSTFTLGFFAGYKGTTLDQKLGLDKKEVSAEELLETATIVVDRINAEAPDVAFAPDGFSVMPYGYSEMNDKLMQAYDKVCEKYDFVQNLNSSVKRIMLSEPMTYTHISGVYTYFTGEANLNTNFPDYMLPYTAAHELAHQRGIAREDEANFVAFLVCAESDDPYIRYSGYLNLYEHIANALYSANQQYYSNVYWGLPTQVHGELSAYYKFYLKYSDNVVGDVSGVINNTFLELNGVEEGSKSYGMVVDLAVAYYKINP